MSGALLLPTLFESSELRAQALCLALQAPRRATSTILGALVPFFLSGSRSLYCLDGANAFDPYVFSREARRCGLGEEILDRVFVTRTFTIHQIAAVVTDLLPPLLSLPPPSPPPPPSVSPVIAILGLDELFREESLRTAERRRVLDDVLHRLGALRDAGLRMLITYDRPPVARERWWKPLVEFGDLRGRVLPGPADNHWKLHLEAGSHGPNGSYIQ